MEKQVNWTHRIGTIAAWLALTVMAIGIGAIAYQARALHLVGEFWEWMAIVVAFAPATSTAVVGYFKFFAVSSREHDKWLWGAFGIDMVAIISQLLTVALMGKTDGMLDFFRIASFVLSALSFLAVMLAAGMSSHRLNMVAEKERDNKIEKALNDTVVDTLKSPEIYQASLILATELVTERFEQLTGRRLMALNGGTSGGTSEKARVIIPSGKKKYVVVDGQVANGGTSKTNGGTNGGTSRTDGGTSDSGTRKRGRPRKIMQGSFSLNDDAPKVNFKSNGHSKNA